MNYNKQFYDSVCEKLASVNKDNNVYKTGEILAQAYINKKNIYTFGTGHSHMLGEELYVRAGGWNYIKPMLLDEITLSSHPWKSTYIERVSDYAGVLLELFPLKKDDVIVITSNSGRNGLIVEMAIRANKIGATVIGVTSLDHAKHVESRHSSKKLLKDVADLVIDNQSQFGDTIVNIADQKCGSSSTIIHCFIAHQMVIKAFEILESKKIRFATFLSSNIDDQDARNESLL